MRIKTLFIFPVLLIISFVSEAKKSYYLSNYDVYLDLQENGEYHVREEITFEFSGGEFTYAYRKIPSKHLDEVYDFEVSSDDLSIVSVEIKRKKGYRLEWNFEPVSRPVTFTLSYKVKGALQEKNGENRIHWTAVGKEWRVKSEDVDVWVSLPFTDITPDSVESVPDIYEGSVSASGTAVLHLHKDVLKRKKHFTVKVDFPKRLDGRIKTIPKGVLIMLFASVSLLLGLIAGYYFNQSKHSKAQGITHDIRSKPSLSIAEAGFLSSSESTGRMRMFSAMIFDLAQRGNIKLERQKKKSILGNEERVRIETLHTDGLAPDEKKLLDEVSKHKYLNTFGTKAYKFRSNFLKSVREHMVGKGYYNPVSEEANQWLLSGFVVFLCTVAGFYYSMPLGALLAAITGFCFTVGSLRYIVTDMGALRKEETKRYLSGLRKGIEDQFGDRPEKAVRMFMEDLPWVMLDSKINSTWMSKLKKSLKKVNSTIELPDWFVNSVTDTKKESSEALTSFMPFYTVILSTSGLTGAGAVAGAGAAGAAGGGGGGAG